MAWSGQPYPGRPLRMRDRGYRQRGSGPAVSADHQPDGQGKAEQHAEREEQRYTRPVRDQPADPPVGKHAREKVAEHGHSDVLSAVALRRALAVHDPPPAPGVPPERGQAGLRAALRRPDAWSPPLVTVSRPVRRTEP